MHAATEVVDVFCGQRNELTTGQRTEVVDVTGHIQAQGVVGKQCAVGRQVAIAGAGIELRNKNLLRGTVRQADVLFNQPDHVAGQLRHLLGGQADAGAKIPGFGIGNAGIHERLVLRFIVSITDQEATSGELRHLFIDQALFVETVAETFLRGVRIEREGLDHIVASQPVTVVGKARIGFDQRLSGSGIGVVEAATRQCGRWTHGGDGSTCAARRTRHRHTGDARYGAAASNRCAGIASAVDTLANATSSKRGKRCTATTWSGVAFDTASVEGKAAFRYIRAIAVGVAIGVVMIVIVEDVI